MFCMALPSPTVLSDEDKLAALRRLDQFREWRSLDDKRFCLVCGRVINGRQIKVTGGARGNGMLRLNCPTQGCNSIPMDWVLLTDEILAVAETATPEEQDVAHSKAHDSGVKHSLTWRLRRFAVHLKQAF